MNDLLLLCIISLILFNSFSLRYRVLILGIVILCYVIYRYPKNKVKSEVNYDIAVMLDKLKKIVTYQGHNILFQSISERLLLLHDKINNEVNSFYRLANDLRYNIIPVVSKIPEESRILFLNRQKELPIRFDPSAQNLGVVKDPDLHPIIIYNEVFNKLKKQYDTIIKLLYEMLMTSANSFTQKSAIITTIKYIKKDLNQELYYVNLNGRQEQYQNNFRFVNKNDISIHTPVEYIELYKKNRCEN